MATIYNVDDYGGVIQNAIDAIPNDLLGLGEQRVIVPAGVYAENPTFAGFANYSLADFVTMYGAPGRGKRGLGTIISSPGIAAPFGGILTLDPYVQVYNIAVTASAVINSHAVGIKPFSWVNDVYEKVKNCIVYDIESAAGFNFYGIYSNAGVRVTADIQNCVVENILGGAWGAGIYVYANNTFRVHNCTVMNARGGTGDSYGVYMIVGTHNDTDIANCIAIGSAGAAGTNRDYFRGAGVTAPVRYCISEDGTADDYGGAGNQVSKDPDSAIRLLNSTPGSEDGRIREGSCAINAGIDLTSFGFDDDMNGGSREYPWDIGAFEYGTVANGYLDNVNVKALDSVVAGIHEIDAASPKSFTTAGGTLRVYGKNFIAGVAVKVGSVTCNNVTAISPGLIECTIPAISAGTYDLSVTIGTTVVLQSYITVV